MKDHWARSLAFLLVSMAGVAAIYLTPKQPPEILQLRLSPPTQPSIRDQALENAFHRMKVQDSSQKTIVNLGSTEESPPPLQLANFNPQRGPFLRIDQLPHAQGISAMRTSRDGEYLVTGSPDNTARLWKITSDGQPLILERTFRPPLFSEEIGSIAAVDISPDNSMIAVGGDYSAQGYLASIGDHQFIFIFDAKSGALIKKLRARKFVVTSDVAFTPDGRYLLAGFPLGRAMRVYDTTTWERVGNGDLDFSGDEGISKISIGGNGNIAVLAHDFGSESYSLVRTFTPQFEQLSELKSTEYWINDIAISPDGSSVAIAADGRLETTEIRNLKHSTVISDGSIYFATAWSVDGKTLHGGILQAEGLSPPWRYQAAVASYKTNGTRALTQVVDGIGGPPHLLTAAKDDIIIASDGITLSSLVEGGESPFANPLNGHFNSGFMLSYNKYQLRVSADGRSVSAPFYPVGSPNFFDEEQKIVDVHFENFFKFDLESRALSLHKQEVTELSSPIIKHGLMEVRGINDDDTEEDSDDLNFPAPEYSVNGRVKKFRGHWIVGGRSVAIFPSGKAAAVGTTGDIRVYDQEGKRKWRAWTPNLPYKINVSGDEKFVIAGLGDGTVRWYDAENGRERLALYVTNNPDSPDWILWTPSGYYDASPGGEDIIGWHIDQDDEEEALFFPVSRFRSNFYRPDIVKKALTMPSEQKPPSLDELFASAPPVVNIVDYRETENGDVVIEYEIIAEDADNVDVELFVDDAKVKTTLRGARSRSASQNRRSIVVPRGACAVSNLALVARDETGRASDAAVILSPLLSETACADDKIDAPNLYAIVVGVSDYENKGVQDLGFAHQDAIDFAALLKAQEGVAYNKVSVELLINEDATKVSIQAALEALQDDPDIGSNDATVLFFAGHGVKQSSGGKTHYLLSYDATFDRLASTAVSQSRLIEAVQNRSGRKFIFLDACYSNFSNESGVGLFDMNGIANILGGADIRAEVFSSSTGDQLSWEHQEWRNGAFTEALVEAFGGAADYPPTDDRITNDELSLYVKRRVRSIVLDKVGEEQTPTHTTPGTTEYPLGAVRENK